MTDPRPEGLYINPYQTPPEGTLGSTVLTKIERVNGDCTVTSIILSPLETVHALDRLREIQRDTEPKTVRSGPESRESVALRESAASCVRRLLEIGLPEKHALHARDAVLATVDNILQRQRCGEWEPR